MKNTEWTKALERQGSNGNAAILLPNAVSVSSLSSAPRSCNSETAISTASMFGGFRSFDNIVLALSWLWIYTNKCKQYDIMYKLQIIIRCGSNCSKFVNLNQTLGDWYLFLKYQKGCYFWLSTYKSPSLSTKNINWINLNKSFKHSKLE